MKTSSVKQKVRAGFHMIATIAEENSSAIVTIYDFHMIAAIAEKVNED